MAVRLLAGPFKIRDFKNPELPPLTGGAPGTGPTVPITQTLQGGPVPKGQCGLGLSWFWLMGGLKYYKTQVETNLNWIAEYVRPDYVRAFAIVGGKKFQPENEDPWEHLGSFLSWPDHGKLLEQATDMLHDKGIRVQWTLIGTVQQVPTAQNQDDFVRYFASHMTGRLDKLELVEMMNEYWANDGNITMLRRMAQVARPLLGDVPISLSSPAAAASGTSALAEMEQMYKDLPQATAATPHWCRTSDATHVPPDLGPYCPPYVYCDEPRGPGASTGGDMRDPAKLAADYQKAVTAKYSGYVYHTDWGIWCNHIQEAFADKSDGWANLEDVENNMAIVSALRNTRSAQGTGLTPAVMTALSNAPSTFALDPNVYPATMQIKAYYPYVGILAVGHYDYYQNNDSTHVITLDGISQRIADQVFLGVSQVFSWWPGRKRMVFYPDLSMIEWMLEPKTLMRQASAPPERLLETPPPFGMTHQPYVKLLDRWVYPGSIPSRVWSAARGRNPIAEGPVWSFSLRGLRCGRTDGEVFGEGSNGDRGQFYTPDTQQFTSPVIHIGMNSNALMYAPEWGVLISGHNAEVFEDASPPTPQPCIRIWSLEVDPQQLTEPVADIGTPRSGQVVQYRVQLMGEQDDPAEGELVDWSLTGAGALLDIQTKTDADGYAIARVQYLVGETGTTVLEARVQC